MDKKSELEKTFDAVAQGYDHPALSFFPETAKRMVEHLQLPATARTQLLDVCTGTGVVALQAAQQSATCTVTGIDLSTGMLAQAQAKAAKQSLTNTTFSQMDLDALKFDDHRFDYACCSFGLFFLDDMQQGLNNMAAKIKSGGKIAISTFAEGAFEPMSQLFTQRVEAMGYAVPTLSWKQMTTDAQLFELFSSAGIAEVSIHREPLGFHMKSANDWWDVVWNAGYRGLLLAMTEAELAEFKQQHLQEIQRLCDQGDTWLDTGVAIALGTVKATTD